MSTSPNRRMFDAPNLDTSIDYELVIDERDLNAGARASFGRPAHADQHVDLRTRNYLVFNVESQKSCTTRERNGTYQNGTNSINTNFFSRNTMSSLTSSPMEIVAGPPDASPADSVDSSGFINIRPNNGTPLDRGAPASLVLENGVEIKGFSFGAETSAAGEVVFNTGMVGYPESLTDPSYTGQILVLTYPLIGNYGVPGDDEVDEHGLFKHFEGKQIYVKGIVVADYSFESSHYQSKRSLSTWLKKHNIPGMYGVDTRAITKMLRNEGAILGKIEMEKDGSIEFDDPNKRNLPAEVSCKEKIIYTPKHIDKPKCRIVAMDFGIKYNIIRYFVNVLGVELVRVPWDYDICKEIDNMDGLFLSNGPGDPSYCQTAIDHLRKFMQLPKTKPIFGICLGNQLLALAAGATTYKMKFGNRGMNQPCVDLRTLRCYITPQNHGFAVDSASLPADWSPFFVNGNDDSNEGIIHRVKPWFSVQFHPEACGGPTDTSFLFTQFIDTIMNSGSLPLSLMPYRRPQQGYKKVLVLGSGGLSIGQAGEFDYSGSQCIKALKEAGVESILINPNIATVQTSAGLADKVYFLPVTPQFVEEVIKKEEPDGIFCTFGGQTALNCAVQMFENGIFEKYGVTVLGTPISAIIMTEDREKFAEAVDKVGYKVAESKCCNSVEEAVAAADSIGYPVLVRAAFALGGLGSGFCANREEVITLTRVSFQKSSQVIVDKSLKGWKELEYEVVRDSLDNCITVCNMENFDPMGIHTGDSIVVAPSQTLTNAEYQRLRDCALKMIRHLGVIGECNIQYAVDPHSDQFRIIEVNARLSRSSALASKATGYPLAYVAAKLGLGHDLVHLRNAVTKSTTACFEPSLDYCVVKIPRWDLKKFVTVDKHVGSCMKSVGEIMAIGRTFEETMQKALRMVDEACTGFDGDRFDLEAKKGNVATLEEVKEELADPSPVRIFAVAKAFQYGLSVHDVHHLTKIDRWFLSKLYNVHSLQGILKSTSLLTLQQDNHLLETVKRHGFSDRQIAKLVTQGLLSSIRGPSAAATPSDGTTVPSTGNISSGNTSSDSVDGAAAAKKKRELKVHDSIDAYTSAGRQMMVDASSPRARQQQLVTEEDVRHLRFQKHIHPSIKQVDTVAGEFPAETNYLYLTYNGDEHDVHPIRTSVRSRKETLNFDRPGSPRFRMRTPSKPSPVNSGTDRFYMSGADFPSPNPTRVDLQYSDDFFNPMPRSTSSQAPPPGRTSSSTADKGSSVIVLGCGCYRIGSSVEFDWCCVQAVKTIHKAGRPAIVINCNPETVSTDYDESDRLYFDELSHETVLEIYHFESPYGLVISVGGQVPNNLAMGLVQSPLVNVRILGTSVAAIDSAENRFKFSQLCDKLQVDQPDWSEFSTYQEALAFCNRVDFPVLVRPSYVLSGAAMRVVDSAENLYEFLRSAAIVSRDYPVVISKYVENAKEVEFDGVGCDGAVVNYAISEHVENAGVHSGDATLLLPAQKLYVETHRRVKKVSTKIAKALSISGPFNIQFMCKDNEVKVIECNLRASRTFPFISKTFNINLIALATKVMLGQIVHPEKMHPMDLDYVGCKVPVFSFSRLKNSDPRLGVEMQSTGEVACYGMTKYEAYLKALVSSGLKLPEKNILVSVGHHASKMELLGVMPFLQEMGYQVYCTKGTFEFFKAEMQNFTGILVHKPHVKKTPNVTDLISQNKIDLLINVPDSMDSQGATDGFQMRRLAVDCNVPLFYDIKTSRLFIEALYKKWQREAAGKEFWGIQSWQGYTSLQ
ncbi:unnamed protein product [Amoebophrya sp. A120]|nr:unnamed protein product [Amoebophrya sp. A120]|eukprot:GSA120T00001281001.1